MIDFTYKPTMSPFMMAVVQSGEYKDLIINELNVRICVGETSVNEAERFLSEIMDMNHIYRSDIMDPDWLEITWFINDSCFL